MGPLLFLALCLAVATLFVTAEMALASASRPRLTRMARQGSRGAEAALRLLEEPAVFLSTVQVGITFTGVLAAIVSGGELSAGLAKSLEASGLPWVSGHALVVAEGIVSFGIGSVTIVFAEIVPKRLAMAHAETYACWLARPMAGVAWAAYPWVRALGWAAEGVLRLAGWRRPEEAGVSEEDLRMLVETGHATGRLHDAERRIMLGALSLDGTTAAQLMTPARKVTWLDLRLPDEDNWRRVIRSGHTWFPVHRGSPDDLAGVVSVKRLWANLAMTGAAPVKDLLTGAATVPPDLSGSALLELFQTRGAHVALVNDEFGRVLGIVTLNDILERLVGRLPGELPRPPARAITPRTEGGWLVDGDAAPEELRRAAGVEAAFSCESEQGCATMAGLVMRTLGRIPREGDVADLGPLEAEVVDLDGTRIDKLLVRRKA